MQTTFEPTRSPSSLSRSVSNTLKGSAGNLVEWYDVYVYSVFATYFEAKFFRPDDKNATLFIWAIFAVTFLMRPIGAWYFGRFADRHGRRQALAVSITLMAACSFAIAVTPSVDRIGAAAAVILVVARLVQGFATGGEYGTSATYMSESAIRGHRGFLSSFHYVTLVGGHVLAQLLLLFMLTSFDATQISDWGWRVAFGIGGLAAIGVWWLRTTMDESLSAEAIEDARIGGAKASGSLHELFFHQWRPLLLCFLITAGGTVAFYTYSINGPKIVQSMFVSDNPLYATYINLAALTLLMLLQPLGGWISDIIGRKSLLVFFGAGGGFVHVGSTALVASANRPCRCICDLGVRVCHPDGLHLYQCRGEIGALSDTHSCTGCRSGVCLGQFTVRRHCAPPVPSKLASGPGGNFHRLCHRGHCGLAVCVCVFPEEQGRELVG